MKKMKISIVLCIILTTIHAAPENIQFTLSGAQQVRMPLALIVLDDTNELHAIANVIQKDMEFTGQFQVSIIQYPIAITKKELKKEIMELFDNAIPLALCLNTSSQNVIEWRLYDTAQACMIEGKQYKKQGTVERGWAHAIADGAWQTVTGHAGFFSSRIAYCKEIKTKKGKTVREIHVTDFDGSNKELLVDATTVVVAPRWSTLSDPLLFFSEYTNTNVRLVAIDMNKKRKITSNFDGINMLPAFSQDGKSVVYCASHGDGNCQLYYYRNNNLKQCTNNIGNNASPVFIDNHTLCFCSDAITGNPQIYFQDIESGVMTAITHGGYCTSPHYSLQAHKIVYHKMVSGVMQIYMYDCAYKTHTPLTCNGGNKHEACFSPCGTQLIFAHEYASGRNRIENLNLLTNQIRCISDEYENCTYPHWSGCFHTFPVISS